jgi:hypothetical protein
VESDYTIVAGLWNLSAGPGIRMSLAHGADPSLA